MMTLTELRRLEGGAQPNPAEAQQMAKGAYGSPPSQVGNFRLLKFLPAQAVAFYEDDEGTIVMAIAGTQSASEAVTEWWRVPTNQIEGGERYKQAESALRQARRDYPDTLEWYGVGHSLGGAIIDSLIERGLLDAGHSFNPAIQTKHLREEGNTREFQEGDILGQLAKPFAKNISYRRNPSGWASRIAQSFNPAFRLWDALNAHDINNFAGGGLGGLGGLPAGMAGGATHRLNVLKKLGLKDEGHSLEELAEASGVPKATLQQVFNRGIGAYKTQPKSVRMKGSFKKGVDAPMSKKLSKEQWALARVYSFLDGNPKHDEDLRGGGEMEGGIRPFLCRVGSKAKFAKLLDFIAPPHKIYVEPFVGSGAFYWHKQPVEKEVLNDLDKNVAKTLRLIKQAPTDISKYPTLSSKESAKRFYLAKPRGTANELVWQLVSHCGGWMGQPVNPNTGTIQREGIGSAIASKLSHIAEYKERMKHTSVTSQDYAVLLRKYGGSKDSFIFMDPPYEDSDNLGYAEELGFDFDRFATEVKKLKANWLITINDSKRIRELFKSYHIQPVLIKGHKGKFKTEKMGAIANTIGSKDRRELLISNFPLPSGWRAHKGARVG